jgi:hypothetical protein
MKRLFFTELIQLEGPPHRAGRGGLVFVRLSLLSADQ